MIANASKRSVLVGKPSKDQKHYLFIDIAVLNLKKAALKDVVGPFDKKASQIDCCQAE